MNILIPMAGAGSRFADQGYTVTKPLIPVNGVPMILKAVQSLGINGRYIFIIRKNKSVKEYLLLNVAGSVVLEIDYLTEGAACTALLAKNLLYGDDLIIANCDQIMHWNGSQFMDFVKSTRLDGCIVTYYKNHPKNSYARVNLQGFVTEVKEKEVISDISLNGIHYWKRGEDFVRSAEEMIMLNERAINGEFYVGPTYNYLIREGKKVGIYHIPNVQQCAVGTPEDLKEYEGLFCD